MNQGPTLVVMAAGMGSRFGGLKQITSIDESGNFIIDYSIYDALQAGFQKVVFVIKEENYQEFKETIGKRLEGILPVFYAFQKNEDIPFSNPELFCHRTKPWGTVHAILAAKPYVTGDFAVINADDFYGFEPYQKLIQFFQTKPTRRSYVSILYPFCQTASTKGAVKRGVCRICEEEILDIIECSVSQKNHHVIASPLNGDAPFDISSSTLVSMNVFGFTYDFFELLEEYFREFFQQDFDTLMKSEALLPMCLAYYLKKGEFQLKYFPSHSKWLGMTYKEDLIEVKEEIQKMIRSGVYPQILWK